MVSTPKLKRPYLLLMAAVTWIAVALQTLLVVRVVAGQGRSAWVGVVNTFSYFTVLTNFVVGVVCGASLVQRREDSFLTRPSTLSAVTVYIFIVGLVYTLLLRSVWNPTGLQSVADHALHDATPILFTLFWIFFVPKGTLRSIEPLYWLIYPLLYVAYSLLRGALTGFYPYHFVDVTLLGYPRALLHTVFLLAGFWFVGMIVVAIDRRVGHGFRTS
ncbi:MAG: Pr6Pr family membrane protein [Acidobacteriota bacterium]|nr:Pr6Pr family membrane protein [Acidobacteriota bacterium]